MPIELKKSGGNLSFADKMLLKGEDGGYYIPSVDEEGNLTWTATEDDMPEVAAAKIKGRDGVYVGETEPTDDSLIWINPEGEASEALVTKSYVDEAINTIELMPGPQGIPGKDGEDYVLTAADKTEIANLVIAELPVYNGEVL